MVWYYTYYTWHACRWMSNWREKLEILLIPNYSLFLLFGSCLHGKLIQMQIITAVTFPLEPSQMTEFIENSPVRFPEEWCIPAPKQWCEFGKSCWITCPQAGLSRREDFTLEAQAAIPRGLREETPFWVAKCSFRCSVLMTTDQRIKQCTLKIFLSLSDTEFLQRNSVPASSVINKYAIDGEQGKDLQNH